MVLVHFDCSGKHRIRENPQVLSSSHHALFHIPASWVVGKRPIDKATRVSSIIFMRSMIVTLICTGGSSRGKQPCLGLVTWYAENGSGRSVPCVLDPAHRASLRSWSSAWTGRMPLIQPTGPGEFDTTALENQWKIVPYGLNRNCN